MNREELKGIIKADLFRYQGDSSCKSFWRHFFITPGFRYSYFLRQCSYFRERRMGRVLYILFRLLLGRYMMKYGIEISAHCSIGRGLYIGHWGGVFINPQVKIGKNCNINQGVTIGQTNRGKNKGVPVIGDRVWFGAHCVVVGNIKVGNNVLIAPGAYVNFDVPENAVIIGNPGKIVSYGGTERYINHIT